MSSASLVLEGANTGQVTITVFADAGNTTFTLPNADGTSGQVLVTDGNGVLSFATASGGGGGGAQGYQGYQGAQGYQGRQGSQGYQGVQGATGSAGAQGATGATGSTGAQGAQGATGSQGTVGATGSTGAQGYQGVQGATGATGSTGAQGSQGYQGVQGASGSTGSTGAQGYQGVQGAAGSNGAQGATGAQGVQGATGSGTQGAQGFQGVQGATGPQGPAGSGGGGGIASLPISSNNTVKVTANALNFINSASVLIDVQAGIDGNANITLSATGFVGGAQGAVGAQGYQGVQGATGNTGPTGAQGVQGAQGYQGVQGSSGAGTQGAQGFQGFQGVQGAVGAQGAAGAQGAVGSQGATGAQGVQGAAGSSGSVGAQGVQGATGAQGVQGATGATGSAGAQGATGAQGVQGATGAQGYQGVQGATGVGVQGAQGVQGATGPQGPAGGGGGGGSIVVSANSGSLVTTSNLNFVNTSTVTVSVASVGANANISFTSSGGGGGATSTSPKIKSLVYPGNDLAANTAGGQTVYVLGSNFASNASILINGNTVPSQSFISASNIGITTPALSIGTYPVYLINPEDGDLAILYPGIVISGEPTWNTAAGSLNSGIQDPGSSWSYSLSATGDSAITYALQSGSTLPSGISLSSSGVISGTLSSQPSVDTTYNFTVIASDAQNQDTPPRTFSVTVTLGEGVLFANNILLIHGDGTNNGNNHTFLDSSTNSFTITRNGNATHSTFTPFSTAGWSGYFDGTGDNLAFTAVSLTGDFTVEAWINPERGGASNGTDNAMLFGSDTPNNQFVLGVNRTIGYYNGTTLVTTSATVSLNTWSHVALVRSGSTTKIYINGANSAIIASDSGTRGFRTIGDFPNPQGYNLKGFISNARISANAVYSGETFTVPVSALGVTANTLLLTLNSTRFVDSNTTPRTITVAGDVAVKPFSPLSPTSAYDTTNIGGSVYLDGTGDYLTIADNAALEMTGDFTVEAWFYPTAFSSFGDIITKGASGVFQPYYLWANTTGSILFSSSSNGTSNDVASSVNLGSVSLNTWNHVAVSRQGTSLRLFLNGNLASTITNGSALYDNTRAVAIGGRSDGTELFTGYISGARIVKGTAVYTAAFTPPTSPPTAIANTTLLCNFTNSQIIDQTMKCAIETLGDARANTTTYKYGTGSVYFDGTGDGLKITSPLSGFFDGFPRAGRKFTIECWLYANGFGAPRSFLFGNWNTNGWTVDLTTTGNLFFSSDGAGNQLTLSSPLTTGVWTHLAFVNDGSIITVYKNGTSVGTYGNYSPTALASTAPFYIGMRSDGTLPFNGYIDEFRVTANYTRYTGNFTAPAAAFQNR